MTTLTYRGYGIPIDDERVKNLKDILTVQPNNHGYCPNNTSSKFKVFLESSKKIYIPKYYGLKTFGVPDTIKIDEGENMKENVEFEGSIRDNQIEPVNAFLRNAKDINHMGGILELPPGWGKTVMALYIAATLKKKTIVVVHKDFLLKQWKERIEQYIPKARIGLIKQSSWIVEDCDIVLASLQTICMRNFKNTSFGFVIFDECHHMGAQIFSQAFHKMNFRYSLGLSATINRTDGLTKVFKWFLGDVVYKGKRNLEEQKGLQVIIKAYNDANPKYSFEYLLYNGKPNMSRMLNNICAYHPRTDMICNEIACILDREKNRNVLVLSDRRKHLEDIYDGLTKLSSINNSDLGYYVGGMKNEDLLISETKRILLGTYNMVSEGFDLPKLDTLIMASPKSNVEQSVGRIQRKMIKDREYTPLVLDILDEFSVFTNQAKKRMAFYKKSGFEVQGDYENLIRKTDPFKLSGKSMFIQET